MICSEGERVQIDRLVGDAVKGASKYGWWWWMMTEHTLSERKWIDGGDGVLVHDGLKWVHINAIAGVIWEGYHSIKGGHVLLYDGSDGIFSKEIVRWLGNKLIWKRCNSNEVPPQQNIFA